MMHRLKPFAIFGSVCLAIAFGASLGSKARLVDLIWIGLLWSFMLAATLAMALKAWDRRREPGAFARLGDSRGLWLLPASLRRWLFELP